MRFGGSDFRPMGTGPGSLKPARAQSTTAPYSALQAYSQTAEGRQYLRDHVTRDDDEQAFIATLYNKGKPMYVDVSDTYDHGNQRETNIINIYERAYDIHYGYKAQ